MYKVGFFQVIYTTYQSNNKTKTKKEFIFLEEVQQKNTIEMIKACQDTFKRYKNYNNVITLDYDVLNNAYIFNKSKLVSLKLDTIKGIKQEGEKINIIKRW